MPFNAGAVIGKLELNIEGWKKSVDTVKKDQQSLSGLVMRHEKGIKDLGKAFTVAGAAITASFSLMIKKAADYGDAADEMYQRTGASVELLTGLDSVLRQNDASAEDLATGMKFLSGKMVDANNGNEAAIKLFDDLGISVIDVNTKALRPTADVLFDVATKFKGMENGAVKTTASVDLLGKGGMRLIPTLNLGAEGLRKATERAERFGTVLTQKAAQACSDFNDTLVDLGSATQGLGIQISQTLMPHIQDLIEGATSAIVKIKDWAKENPGLAEGLSKVALGLGGLLTVIGPVVYALPGLVRGIQTLKALGANPIIITVTLAGAALVIAEGQRIAGKFDQLRKEGQSPWQAFTTAIEPFREAELKLIALRDATIDLKGAGILCGDVFRAVKGAIEAAVTPAARLLSVFKDFGLKTKTELTAELAAAEAALTLLRGSAEATPGQIKVLEEKIKGLKEAMTGVTVETKTLAEQLGITFRADAEARVKKLNEALLTYEGKLTADQVKKICEEINKLNGEIKGLEKPVFELGQSFEQAMNAMGDMPLSASEVADDINAAFKDMETEMQADFEKLAMKDLPAHLQNLGAFVEKTADTTATAFETCADDIAKAFGEAFANIIKDGLNLKNFFTSLFQGIVNAASTYIGGELVKIFKEVGLAAKAAGGVAEGAMTELSAAAGIAGIAMAAVVVGFVAVTAYNMIKSKHDWDEYWSAIEARAIAAGKIISKAVSVASLKAPAKPGVAGPDTPEVNPPSRWEADFKKVVDAMNMGVEATARELENLDDAWQALIGTAQELGLEGSKTFVDLILKMREAGTTSKALTEYVLGQLDTVPNALQTLTDNMAAAQNAYIQRIPEIAKAWEALKKKIPKLTDEDFWASFKKGLLPDVPPEVLARFKKGMDGYAQVAITTFEGMIANGRSWMESLTALEGPLASLKEQYKNLGQAIPAFLKPMFDALDIKKKHPAIFQNLDAATTVLTGMRNAAYMTQGSFNALVSSAAKFASAILGAHGNLNTFLKTAKLTGTQVQQLLPTVSQFVGAAASFGLGIPAWMKTFVTKNLPGISWEAFKEKAAAQANAGIATVEELKKIVLTSDATSKELLNFKSYFDASAPWVTRIVSAIDSIQAGSGSTGSGTTGAGAGPASVARWGGGSPSLPTGPKTSNVNLTFNIDALDGADVVRITRKVIIPEIQKFYRHGGMIPASAVGGP